MRAERLKELAAAEGFDAAGVLPVEPSGHTDFLDRWLERGMHGSMAYLERPDARAARRDVREVMPEARTVVAVAHGYDRDDPPGVPDDPSRGVVARYARGRDYHKVIRTGLRSLHRAIEAEVGHRVESRAYVDTGPILERELASKAGLGWFGRNTMLIHPRRGSYFFIGLLLLDLRVEAAEAVVRDHCGSCRACLDACPTAALLGRDDAGAPVMDARRCISYLTIENRGPIPLELRGAIGNRIYGCDICQEVCPFNLRFSEASAEAGYAARGPGERPAGVEPEVRSSRRASHPGTDGPSLVHLMATALDEGAWDDFTRGSAIRRAGRAGLARNVAVALGNWLAHETDPPHEALAVLGAALDDPSPLVRGHAAWALGEVVRGSDTRSGGPRSPRGRRGDSPSGQSVSAKASRILSARRHVEDDEWVREEIDRTLSS